MIFQPFNLVLRPSTGVVSPSGATYLPLGPKSLQGLSFSGSFLRTPNYAKKREKMAVVL
jgi:hypothetical protein